ncbi:hypothetical protein F4604DRAFT_1597257 [Suillus subluteus]|nr:hypothetical protein F4604DRAFT_1597257 [Suillus subluteus]
MELHDYGEPTAASSELSEVSVSLACSCVHCAHTINLIQSTIRSHPTISTITEFYDARITPLEPGLRPARSSFFFWISSGVKFMLLAGGGSIYALILIAAKDLRWSLTTAPAEVSWEVGKMLRHPDKCAEMQLLIQGKIIPIIAALRKRFPLSMPNVINGSISLQLDCTCIRDVDRFIDSVPINNLHFPGSRDRVKNLSWTIEQRRIVEDGGMVMSDIDELKEKLSTFYPGGVKKADSFLVIPMSIIPGALDIRNSDGSLMALICTSMPSSMRSTLFSSLKSAFDGLDIFKNRTANEPFSCTHFSHWNRYGLSGHTAPQGVHPHDLEAAGGRRTNLRQTLPYASKETFTHQQLYLNIQANLGEVFEWIEEEISRHLPDEYKVLVKLVDILPNAEGSPVRPFLSLVVNINVCTVAHRDAKDFELCLVLAVGEFTGGGLVMREQGLVAELRNGDFALFRSGETTHFNLDYLGRRASLVMHTDGGSFRLFRFPFQPHPPMAPKKVTSAGPRPATRASTGSSGTRVKPTPQGASRAKAAPASKGKAKTSSSSAKGGRNADKGPGLTVAEEKILKDLAVKKKKVAEDAAEAQKNASRKRAADCLLEEAGEDEERSDSDSLCDSPPTTRRHLLRSPVEPERIDKGSNMVSKILDDGASSEIEVDSDQVGEGGDEGHQDQEVDDESNKHFSITCVPRSKVKLSNLNSPRTKRIAVCTHKAMRLHVATVNSFPSAFDREELCWDLLVSSTRDNDVLWEKMSLIQSDDDLKAYLIDYNLTYDDASPLQNTIFRLLLSVQWWGPKGEGRKWGQKKNPFFNNIPILALISSAVECVLLGIMRGHPMDFSEAHFKPRNGNVPGAEDTPTTTFNFSALETAGRAAKARKSGTE